MSNTEDFEVVLDTETTGLDPEKGHRIIEIGCVKLRRLSHVDTFHVYINPERSIPAEATKIHGITDADLENKPIFSKIVDQFLTFIEGHRLIIHNAPFDMKFLNHELQRVKQNPLSEKIVTDTLKLAREEAPRGSNSLDALCRRYKINTARRLKHGALLDAELLAEVYVAMRGGPQPDFNLIFPAQTPTAPPAFTAQDQPPRLTLSVSQLEIDAHRDFVHKDVVKPIWDNFWKRSLTA